MAGYTKEIRISTPKGDYQKRISGSYNVMFDKTIKVNNTNTGIDLVNYSRDIANDTMVAPKAILVENTGSVACELLITTAEWVTDDATDSADTLNDASHYLSLLLPAGECVYLPNSRIIGTSTAFGGGMGIAHSNLTPNSNEYVDSGADVDHATAADIGSDATHTTLNLENGHSKYFKVGDLIRLENEICEVTEVGTGADLANSTLTIIRGLYGSTAATHADDVAVRLPFFNMHHDFDDTSYNGGGNGTATVAKTNASGKFRAMNFFGMGRTADAVCDGLVAGSVAIKFYNHGYQEFGLAGINPTTKTGLAASTTYTFALTISGGSSDDVAFTTDSSDTTFGNVISKIQTAIDDKFTAGTNLKNKKATISIVNGDIRITDSSRLSTGAILMAAPSSGTTPFGVGIIPAVGVLEAPVAAKLPDDVVYDNNTYTTSKNTGAFMVDDGKGGLSGAGGSGRVSYETGEISFTGPANAEFVVSVNVKAAHAGGVESAATTINAIATLEARSCNQKVDTDIRIISLG
tara:strand:+ start:1387 stop:2949 length:1563 start_codon:yes stop_codon:yes gene_type:complete